MESAQQAGETACPTTSQTIDPARWGRRLRLPAGDQTQQPVSNNDRIPENNDRIPENV